MQLGFVSAILSELTLDEVLATAAELDYDCVEIMCWPKGKAERRYAGVSHIEVESFGAAEADRVKSLTEKHGVSISGLGYYPNPLSPDQGEAKQATEHICRVIEACHVLGLPQMNSFIGRDWTKSVDDNWSRFEETWRPIVQLAKEKGVRIGIENCPMFFTNDEWPGGKNLAVSPKIWRRMYESIPDEHFGLNFDPSHFVWQHMDYIPAICEFADRIFHAHAKDVRLDKNRLDEVGILAHPLEYHTPKLPGLGEVDWGRFFSVLGDNGYRGPVCVEVEDRAFEGSLESRKASLRQSSTYLRNYIPRR